MSLCRFGCAVARWREINIRQKTRAYHCELLRLFSGLNILNKYPTGKNGLTINYINELALLWFWIRYFFQINCWFVQVCAITWSLNEENKRADAEKLNRTKRNGSDYFHSIQLLASRRINQISLVYSVIIKLHTATYVSMKGVQGMSVKLSSNLNRQRRNGNFKKQSQREEQKRSNVYPSLVKCWFVWSDGRSVCKRM
jgi:hypothetical protein